MLLLLRRVRRRGRRRGRRVDLVLDAAGRHLAEDVTHSGLQVAAGRTVLHFVTETFTKLVGVVVILLEAFVSSALPCCNSNQ